MIVGALVLPRGTVRHHRGVDHAQPLEAVDAAFGVYDEPIAHVPTGWYIVWRGAR